MNPNAVKPTLIQSALLNQTEDQSCSAFFAVVNQMALKTHKDEMKTYFSFAVILYLVF